MNWSQQLDNFHLVESSELDWFAPPQAMISACERFNMALQWCFAGDRPEALMALQKLHSDFPLFGSANHLLGVLLAMEGRFEEALEVLKRLYLIDLPAHEEDIAMMEIEALSEIVRNEETQRRMSENRNRKLMPVMADMANNNLLKRSDLANHNDQSIKIASPREIKRVLSRADSDEEIKTTSSEHERTKMIIQIASIVLILASLVYLFVFVLILPLRAANKERNLYKERMIWLEQSLSMNADANKAIDFILRDYKANYADAEVVLPTELVPPPEATPVAEVTTSETTASPEQPTQPETTLEQPVTTTVVPAP